MYPTAMSSRNAVRMASLPSPLIKASRELLISQSGGIDNR
jgi:hypothetical protein